MKFKISNGLIALAFTSAAFGQKANLKLSVTEPPKLVIGIVIDQMRWDYLYRFYNLYAPDGGFKRLMNNGFSCNNTFINYTPTFTAPGHTCIYTGSVPAIHGIVGNNWYDVLLNKNIYCTQDDSVQTVGANDNAGKMSPRNMLATTITDELRIATNFKSKVIGIAIKDRGAILPAGHAANAAYWYNSNTGNFVTSSYYMNDLPAWVQAFNNRKIVDSLYALNWNTSLSKKVNLQYCTDDNKAYERNPFSASPAVFPYNLSSFIGKDYSKIVFTPQGNDLTIEMAKAAVIAENLGNNNVTDFLAVSLSSTDYVGHSFGPNSWEQLDDFIKLDKTLGNFLDFLDNRLGKGNYTLFLTADHGAANSSGFSKENKLPGGFFNDIAITKNLNKIIKEKTGFDSVVIGIYNFQVVLNQSLIKEKKLEEEKLIAGITEYLLKNEAVSAAFDISLLNLRPMNAKQKEMLLNGYYINRSGSIQIILKPGYVEGKGIGTSHGLWNPYDSHIPLLWYGWGIKQGKTNKEVYMTDIAATLAALLHIQVPSGCIGKVIEEVIK